MHLDANKKQSSATSGLEVNSCRIYYHVAREIEATPTETTIQCS